MFDCGSNDMTPVGLSCVANSLNRQIVRFSSAGGENDLVRARANQRRDLSPRAINRGARFLPERMDTRRVAESFAEVRQQRFYDARVDRRRRAVIEIDFAHRTYLSASSQLKTV